ncbi:MAG: hypothetical protein B7Z58_18770 [Acidiphilium sp. 37-64-53]|uniref:hypothetical protein n=1 Tax=Acidiphilium sp. 37-64-53 TaxID=1970299 RepID=UPI000BD9CAA4|nr:hypothetical protein [Acidiphilium sp. 37-64-53]OYV99226.1 MAG: hypothetical protein B7Z58_18770 [Acidiphilium sp. 37-64-53]
MASVHQRDPAHTLHRAPAVGDMVVSLHAGGIGCGIAAHGSPTASPTIAARSALAHDRRALGSLVCLIVGITRQAGRTLP